VCEGTHLYGKHEAAPVRRRLPEKTAALETDFAANGGALVDLYDGSCGLE
jgi:hypothetical protein